MQGLDLNAYRKHGLYYLCIAIFFYECNLAIWDASVSAGFGLFLWIFTNHSKTPSVDLKYFGSKNQSVDYDYNIKPFKIDIPESELTYLKDKISKTREFNSPLMGVGFKYGCNSDYLKTFLKSWKDDYNWKEREDYLNTFPQFKTRIAGLNIHFIHVKPNVTTAKGKEIVPLLLIHGWPGSLRGLYGLIPLLTTPMESHDFVFEIIAPSVPGNGFSEAPRVKGLDAAQISLIFHNLMSRLGFEKYYIHASDTGAMIGQTQAILHPDKILGYHSNVCIGVRWSSLVFLFLSVRMPKFFLDESKRNGFKTNLRTIPLESGFIQFSSNKPDTLGVAMSDSPAALAANVLEKFASWSNYNRRPNTDGGLYAFDKYDLLDIITIHWLTNSVTSSIRIWKESFTFKSEFISQALLMRQVKVPAGCVWFKNELLFTPLWSLERAFPKLLTLNYLKVGGHFPALEKPLVLSDDIWSFVATARFVVQRDRLRKNMKSEF